MYGDLFWLQWDAEASERRELAAKKAALASAEIAKFSKCVSGAALTSSVLSRLCAPVTHDKTLWDNNIVLRTGSLKCGPNHE